MITKNIALRGALARPLPAPLLALVYAALLLPGLSNAGGFQVFEASATNTASASANQAEAKDASAMYGNPAALAFLPGTQASGLLHLLSPTGHLTNVSGQTTIGGLPIGGSDGGNPGYPVPAGALFYSHALSPNTAIGFGVTTPYGLAVKYDEDWIGRYQIRNGFLATGNFGASAAYKVTPTLNVGFGVDLQYSRTKLSTAVDLSTACLATAAAVPAIAAQCAVTGFVTPGNAATDGRATLKQDSWGAGWNAGVLWQASPELRLGLAYRSKVNHDFEGDYRVSKSGNLPALVAALPALSDTTAHGKVTFPETATASFFYQPHGAWSFMGAAAWTKWSRLNEIRTTFDNGAADGVIALNWRNTWRISGALAYQASSALTLRAGAAFDQAPTSLTRPQTLLIPDADRLAFSLGGSYALNASTSIDMGAIRYQFKEVTITQSSPQAGTFVGTFPSTAVLVLSVQLNHQFK